ncbi:MAG: type I-E CRISPR-associated endoribonuclease Cas2e [Sphaerochaeta sp.]|nr:type I-E CRISPR-associated endoribonuclease Cas2e [Sphaerochaeta sp.]MCH3920515.1 type I-E CRISPR-associated endoribonuclease Cas2e [Sphaerochaeta sp.]MCI2097448.1 type I-E CRISPR-associated endoribonuclease Cas2e [Sphaerochaeta sp.]
MVVVIAEHLPPAVRGRIKCWFIEPKPNTFVSGINDALAENVINYLLDASPSGSGIMIFQSIPQPPWYRIRGRGVTHRTIIEVSGLQLIEEPQEFAEAGETEQAPF